LSIISYQESALVSTKLLLSQSLVYKTLL